MRWYQPVQWQLWCADINLYSDNYDALISTCTVTTMMRWYQPAQWQVCCADINLHVDNLSPSSGLTRPHTDICKCICKAICRKFGIQEHKHCLPTRHSDYTFWTPYIPRWLANGKSTATHLHTIKFPVSWYCLLTHPPICIFAMPWALFSMCLLICGVFRSAVNILVRAESSVRSAAQLTLWRLSTPIVVVPHR